MSELILELGIPLGVIGVVTAVYVLGMWRHNKSRAKQFPDFQFVDSISPLYLGLAIVTLIILLNGAGLERGLDPSEPLGSVLMPAARGAVGGAVLLFLYVTRSEIRWSANGLASRRPFGPDEELAWADIGQAGISEVFRRTWAIDAVGRVVKLGHATSLPKLAEAMEAELGDRFIGMRKPDLRRAETGA